MPHPLLIVSQSDHLIQVVDTYSHTEWQTVQIQISWLLGSAGQGLRNRSVLAVIYWVINPSLEVTSNHSINWLTNWDLLTNYILDLIYFNLTQRKWWKSNCILQILPEKIPPTILTGTPTFTCASNIVDARKNHMTPSNIIEMRTDVSKYQNAVRIPGARLRFTAQSTHWGHVDCSQRT